MKSLLFVDHAFHEKTRSADFFVEILQRAFIVRKYFLNPSNAADVRLLNASRNADVIVLWQMDFLAPLFIAMGKPVIVIPMFDGSSLMPDIHWIFGRRARYINFSLYLNERVRMAGCETLLLRYFPEPIAESELPRFEKLRAFFWQRRPEDGIHVGLVHDLIGRELDALHVHNFADSTGVTGPKFRGDRPYTYTESSWFKDRRDYNNCLAQANVFIAPRASEGIGMALLEAMSHGQVVLAHDAPTASEYISNWCNGILFNKDQPPHPISIRHVAAQISRMAWLTVVEGRRRWLLSEPLIVSWIEQGEPGAMFELDYEGFFVELWGSYYASLDEYTGFLARNITLLSDLSGLRFSEILDVIGEAPPVRPSIKKDEHDCALSSDGTMDLTREDDRYVGTGWSNAESEWRWAVGRKAELYFTGLRDTQSRIRALFTASALPNLGRWVHCVILMNDLPVFEGKIKPAWSDYTFEFDSSLLRGENKLVLHFDKASVTPTDNRLLSVRFKRFAFFVKHEN